jgi:hypothetical protein
MPFHLAVHFKLSRKCDLADGKKEKLKETETEMKKVRIKGSRRDAKV